MSSITLDHGGRKVTFTKVPEYFGVRLTRGRASSQRALESAVGPAAATVRHVESTGPAGFELFAVPTPQYIEETTDSLRASTGTEAVTHVYSMNEQSDQIVIPTGGLTVRFKSDVSQEDRLSILQQHGLEVVEELDYLPHAFRVRVSSASAQNPLKIALALQQSKLVDLAEPDLGFRPARQADPLFADQWHLKNDGDQLGLKAGADVKAEVAWEWTKGSRAITICVIDDGFDLAHPDFNGANKIVAPRDFGEGDQNPNPALEDDNHGTSCAGVALAEENGIGVVGLAPRCSFMPVCMSNWLTDDAIEAMFKHAMDNGADVISCSWSAANWNFPLSTRVSAHLTHVATQGRGGKGCVILFAAGNEDRPLDGMKDGQRSVQGFALHPDVVAVAASNSLDERSYYSNFGPQIAIAAPSSGSPGRGVTTTDRLGAAGYGPSDYTSGFGGTSSATPLAAGLAGLILSANPNLTAREVKQIMMETAEKIDPNIAYVGGHSEQLGHGRIDAGAAVKRALGIGAGAEVPQTLYVEHRVTRTISDNKETRDVIEFPIDAAIAGLEVSLELRHTWVGDLRVALIAPDKTETVLHNRSGGGQDDLVTTYRSGTSSGWFANLIGKSAKGRWTLLIKDNAAQDEGALQKWGVGVTYRAAE